MRIGVKSLAGENCLTFESGEKVYELIFSQLRDGKAVHLDFEGVRIFASPFFNAAVGRLLKDFDSDTLNLLVKIENINPVGLHVLRQVIKNSSQYYRDLALKQALDEVMKEQSEVN